MKKDYMVSRIILFVLAILLTLVAFINEDPQTILIATTLFAGVTLLTSFLATPISKKMLLRGKTFDKLWKKILYYIGMLLVVIAVICVTWTVIYWLMDRPKEGWDALGQAVKIIAFLITAVIIAFVPYLETLLVLLLGKVKKEKNN